STRSSALRRSDCCVFAPPATRVASVQAILHRPREVPCIVVSGDSTLYPEAPATSPRRPVLNLRPSLLACAGLLFVACNSTGPAPVETPPEHDSAPTYPHWAGKPVSWSKLGDIEDWLAGPGPEQYPAYVPRAELELAEGRLELAQKEGKTLSP